MTYLSPPSFPHRLLVRGPAAFLALARGARFFPGKKAMPEAADCALFLVCPGEMTVLAIKLLGNNFEGAKHDHQPGRHEFASHLRILYARGAALWATNTRRRDIRIAGLPLNH